MYWISDQTKIAVLYRALMDEKSIITGGPRPYLMAILGREGQLILFNEESQSQMGPGEPGDNYKQYTQGLTPLRLSDLLLDCKPSYAKMPIVQPLSVKSCLGGNETGTAPLVTRTSKDPRLWPLVYRLVWQFNPDTINPIFDLPDGVVHHWKERDKHLEVALSTPVSFRILVWPHEQSLFDEGNTSKPPCADASFQTAIVDTILVFENLAWLEDRPTMEFVFGSKGKTWYRTASLPRREIKGYDKEGNPILGNDLFVELVKELEKTAK